MLNILSKLRENYLSHFRDEVELRSYMLKFGIPTNLFLSLLYVVVIGGISKDVLNAIITLFSILIGFSYSVMIFLSSSPRDGRFDASDREARLRSERINRIALLLYGNLNVFCISSIFLVVLSLLGISTQNEELNFLKEFRFGIFRMIANFFFVWLFLELCEEFFRILTRTNYLFAERIKGLR